MAWRIDEQVVHGEIDNRTPGRVTGEIWFSGREEPVLLDLEGNPCQDLAGQVLRFTNPDPKPNSGFLIASHQKGTVGEMTASRKVRIPTCSMDELADFHASGKPFPWQWGNSIYLEWHSITNGGIVIESARFKLELVALPTDDLTDRSHPLHPTVLLEPLPNFKEPPSTHHPAVPHSDLDDDSPRSFEEARADAIEADMQLIKERIFERLIRDEIDILEFEKIHTRERQSLFLPPGIHDRGGMSENTGELLLWIEEMDEIATIAYDDIEAERWSHRKLVEENYHPLVNQCTTLTLKINRDVHDSGWMTEGAQEEHPLRGMSHRMADASAKLAGTLGTASFDEEWPPDFIIAGHVVARLKKARSHLNDVLLALDSADEEALAAPQWRHEVRTGVAGILAEVQDLLRGARSVLEWKAPDEDLEDDPNDPYPF